MKRLALLGMAVSFTTIVLGADLNPAVGTRAGSTYYEPASKITWDGLKHLAADANVILTETQRNNMSSYNGVHYTYNYPYYHWVFCLVKITTPTQIHDYVCHWEAHTDNEDYPMCIYAWDPRPYDSGGERFVLKDIETECPTYRSFDLIWRYFYYDPDIGQYVCWLLVQGYWPLTTMETDVTDVSY